ncbi:MAG: hypothetical protein JWP89_178 [Schlesneria sp.]|nr:hypothetical protein [Schlesneria sp.]
MSQLASPELLKQPSRSGSASIAEFEDDSPFGLQGLMRESISILKPDCVTRLAITLALRGTRRQIRDMSFVNRVLSYDPSWLDEYQVVHLIERSLWIQGHSDLVMTLTRNPTQIPDNPPPKIMQALARANALHPTSTVWYGVPVFGDDKNADGLPIPVTANQVRAEADRRIRAAQQHALWWGWAYRGLMSAVRFPGRCWQFAKLAAGMVWGAARGVAAYCQRARDDARRRARAEIQAQLEYYRSGCSQTLIPAHTTWLGQGLDTGAMMLEYQAALAAYLAPLVGASTAPLLVAKFAPLLFIPLTIVSTDPFLFVELPDEPGKLRHLGHWYWQDQPKGRQKLHLHV